MRCLKKISLLFILASNIQIFNAQEADKSMFSISFGIGYYDYFSSNSDNAAVSFVGEKTKKPNINLNADIAFEIDTYILSFYFAKGMVEPIAYKQDSYSEYNLTIGKEFLKKGKFALEGHLGIGYFENKERFAPDGPIEVFGTLGFPLRIKAYYYLTKNFALGLNPNANINFDTSIMSINLSSKIRF